jgi:hypothetical protein
MKVILILFALTASASAETFRNPSGQIVGRTSTDARGNTTFYNPMGQQTGRAVPSAGGTTFYNTLGQQTGTARRR